MKIALLVIVLAAAGGGYFFFLADHSDVSQNEEAAAIALHDLEVPVAAWGLDNHIVAVDDLLGRDEAAF